MKQALTRCRWSFQVLLWGISMLSSGWSASLAVETADPATTLSEPMDVQTRGLTSQGNLAYRRLFVPANDPERWPVGNQRYLPMNRVRFESRLQQVQANRRMPAAARIRPQSMILRAQLSRMGRSSLNSEEPGSASLWQLAGTAEMEVVQADARADVLVLEPLNLAVSSVHWAYSKNDRILPQGNGVHSRGEVKTVTSEEPLAVSIPARWGLWEMGGLAGRVSSGKSFVGVSVDRPGTLRFQWQVVETRQEGVHENYQSMKFVLRTPCVVRKTMELKLPADAVVEAKPGIVVGEDPQEANFRVWHLELGAATKHVFNIRLRTDGHTSIQPMGLLARQARMPRIRQSTEYQLSPEGLDLVTAIQYEDHAASDDFLQLRLADSTRILGVTLDGRSVAWEIVTTEDSSRLQIPVQRGAQVVQIRAMLPIVTDASWQLPTIRPLGVFWTQGTTSLVIHPRLQLQSFIPIDCTIQHVQHALGTMGAPIRYDLLESSGQATLWVVVGKQPIQLQLRMATTANQRDNTVLGHTVAVIRNMGQPQYFVEAEIAPHWKLLSAETEPVDRLARWDVFGDGDRQVVRIQLASALLAKESVRIELDGRAMTDFATEKSEVATVESLRMVKFRNVTEQRQLLLLYSQPAGRLAGCREAQEAQVAVESLTPQEKRLLPEGWQGVLLDMARLASSAVIDLTPQRAIYTADVHVDLSVLPEKIEHRYWIECVPTSGAVTDIAMQFSQSVPKTMSWEMQGDGSSETIDIAAKPGPSQNVPQTAMDEKTFRLVLPSAMDKPFRLKARYQMPLPLKVSQTSRKSAKVRIVPNVIRLPEALTSQTWVLFRTAREDLDVEAGESVAVAFPSLIPPSTEISPATGLSMVSPRQAPPVLGCYRLDAVGANQGVESTDQKKALPALVPRAVASQVASSDKTAGDKNGRVLFARFVDFITLCSADGTALNEMVYFLENHGATHAEVVMPVGSDLQSVWLDARKLNPARLASDHCAFQLSLGSTESKLQGAHHILTFRYVSHGQPLGWQARVKPACPSVSFPVMHGRWALWTAEPWAVRRIPGASPPNLEHWRQQLFGPLARWSHESLFNPLQGQDWKNLWTETIGCLSSPRRLSRSSIHRQSVDKIYPVSLHPMEANSTPTGTDSSPRVLEMPGWRLHAMDFVGQPDAVDLVRVDTAQAKWFLLWLSVALVGAWQLARWPRFLWTALAVVAATCLLVEPDWISAGSKDGLITGISGNSLAGSNLLGGACQAVFLGLLTALILRCVLHWPGRLRPGRRLTVVLMTLVLGFGSHGITLPCGASPRIPANPQLTMAKPLKPRSIHSVLIPVNPQEQLTEDGEVYVPEALYRQLVEPPHQVLTTAQWVLTAAHYHGSLRERVLSNQDSQNPMASQRQYVCSDWKLSFDITSLQPHCQWILPLRRESAQWFENEHRLDGEPLQVDWLPGDTGCRVLLLQPGTHRLELALCPHVLRLPRMASIRVSVPAVAGATLDLQMPAELAGLVVPHATSIESSSNTKSIRALLQPVHAVEVHWTPAHRTVDARAGWNAEQLVWLKVEPPHTLLEMKLRISAGASPLPAIQLDTDPQLELLPLEPGSPIDDLETFAGNPRTLQFKLRPEIHTPVDILLRFRLARDTSIGRIAYPRLRLVNVATSRQVLAVSVAAGLSYQEQAGSDWKVLSPEEFLTQWGDAPSEPLFAYVLSNRQSAHSRDFLGGLSVRPDPQSFIAKQALQLQCGLENTAVSYHAQIDSIAGPLFIHRLEVPTNLRLESVHVQERSQEESMDVRWATVTQPKTRTREVTVFLPYPMRGPHEVVLLGNFVQQPNMPVRIPRIVLKDADATPTQVEIFRDSNVLVEGNWPRTMRKQDREPPSTASQAGVHVDGFQLTPRDQQTIEFTVTPNNPRFSAECLTALQAQKSGWSTTFWVQIHVLRGVVDRFEIEVPETWIEPTVVGARAQLKPLAMDTSDGGSPQGRHRYEIRLKQPLAQEGLVSLQIIGRLELDTDQLARMPDIQVVGSTNTVRYLALPQTGQSPLIRQNQLLEWRRRGLQPAVLSRSLGQVAQLEEASKTYLVVQNGYMAEQSVLPLTAGRVMIPLAEMHGEINRQGDWEGTAMLVLQPGRAADCQLRLPPHSQLLQLSVGGQSVPWIPLGDSSWRVALGPPFMPRRITVSYTTQWDMHRGVAKLRAPELLIGELAYRPASSIWAICVAGNVEPIDPSADMVEVGHEIDALTFAMRGYQRCIQSLENTSSMAFQLPHWEAIQWFFPWQSYIEWAEARWKQLENASLADVLPSPGVMKSSVGTPDDMPSKEDNSAWHAMRKALGHPEPEVKNHFMGSHASPLDPWEKPDVEVSARARQNVRYYTAGPNGVLAIRLSSSGGEQIRRGLLACLIVAFTLFVLFMDPRIRAKERQTALPRKLARALTRIDGPHGMMLAIGLVWWAWLTPSVVGFAVVVIVGLSLIRI